jgi:hypothetical protein
MDGVRPGQRPSLDMFARKSSSVGDGWVDIPVRPLGFAGGACEMPPTIPLDVRDGASLRSLWFRGEAKG